ncbi:MAG: isoprenyl transferase [Saprospiraceae bacterium]
MDWKSQIDKSKLPKHVAVIMDGNGRWAKEHGRPRVFGHRNGVKAVRETAEAAAEIGVKYVTLYAFSTENWNRPKYEVDALMTLLVSTLRGEVRTLNKNNIKLEAIGDLENLPRKCFQELTEAIEKTKDNTRMTLVLALNYSGRWEITNAVKEIAVEVKAGNIDENAIDNDLVNKHLKTANIPDPELLIRTSGESRISNFLLWQLAYTEFMFLPIYWPDFRREHFYESLVNFQQRERRFGKTSEQVSEEK